MMRMRWSVAGAIVAMSMIGACAGDDAGDHDTKMTVAAAAAAGSDAGTAAPITCDRLPATDDYGALGPFEDATMFSGVGPNAQYTLFRPDASLGRDGFKHPIATWGNGIGTTPDQYKQTLTLVASHGFVIIACNDTGLNVRA